MVTVFVGAQKKKYVLHKMLVCREAPYFDKAFNGSFEEASNQHCFLLDEAPSAFELFVAYIYTNRFADDVLAVAGVLSVYEPIVTFYVLADKLLMSKTAKTASLDALIKARATSASRLDEITIKFVLAHTAEECPLRKLVLNMMCRDFLMTPVLGKEWLVSCLEGVTFEQTTQLLMAMKHFSNIKPGLIEDFSKKMWREKRSIASAPEYQIEYLKAEQGPLIKGPNKALLAGGSQGVSPNGGW
jgi:hypothetical protein